MKIVLDTNVFISSFLGKGYPRQIINLWKTGQITICLSQPIIEEYLNVLEKLGLHEEPEYEELLQLFVSGFHTLFAGKTPILEIVSDDPSDNKFFECAAALNAKIIVSGDKHLLEVGKYVDIEVKAPRDFVVSSSK